MKYAILTPSLEAVTEVREWDVLPKHKLGRIVPLVTAPPPAFDPATHKLQPGGFTVGQGQVVQDWHLLPLTGFEVFQHAITSGHPVTPEGFTLRLDDPDRAAFAQMLALVKEALDLGMITDETPQLIADTTGTRHEVTTLRFRQIMVAYGLHYKALWDTLTATASSP